MLAIDEIVNHAALNRPRPIQRIERRQIFDGVRLVAPQHIAHAVRFKLEHAGSEPAMEDLLVCNWIVRNSIQIGERILFAAVGLYQLQRVIENRERGQAQEVHFEQAHLLDGNHVECSNNFVVLRAIQRYQFLQRLG